MLEGLRAVSLFAREKAIIEKWLREERKGEKKMPISIGHYRSNKHLPDFSASQTSSHEKWISGRLV